MASCFFTPGYWKITKDFQVYVFHDKEKENENDSMDVSCLKAESPAVWAEVIKPSFFTGEKVLKNGSKENWSSWGCRFLYQRQKKSPDPRAIPDLIPEAGPLGGIYSCLKQTVLMDCFLFPAICPYLHLIWGNALLWEAEVNGML